MDFITIPALILGGYLGLTAYSDWNSTTFHPIDAPSSVTSKGYTPSVLRMALLAELDEIRRTANSRFRDVRLDESLNHALQDVGKAFNLAAIHAAARSVLRFDLMSVNGYITEDDKQDITLTLGVVTDGKKPHYIIERGPATSVPQLIERAAFRLMKYADPYLAALYMRETERAAGDLSFKKTLELIDYCFKNMPQKDFHYVFNIWGRVLFFQGKYEESLSKYEAGLRVKPNFAFGHVSYARSLNVLKRHAEALAAAETALNIGGEEKEAAVEAAVALNGLGRTAEAEQAYERAAKAGPGDVDIHLAYADQLKRDGRTPQARALLANALSHNPTDKRLQSAFDALR